MRIEIPEKVNIVLNTLHGAGYEAYVVGGCVRDSILGRIPQDWDITTSALPEEVKELFKRTVDTGIKHGTVTVLIGGEQFEVTTYRIDGDYHDGRHPEQVTFTRSLEEDLKRRDFTINAMAYNDKDGIVDCFEGLQDLDKGIIRAVGDPAERFSEDALRILRAIRFSAQLGYRIEDKTAEAIKILAPTLKKISAERIRTELVKLIVSPHPEELLTAAQLGVTAVVLPEFNACLACEQNNPHHCYSVGRHIIESVKIVENTELLRLTMLLHDVAKPLCKTTDEQGIDHFYGHTDKGAEMADEIFRRLKFDNATRKNAVLLIRLHDKLIDRTPAAVRRGVTMTGRELFPMLMKVKRADIAAQSDYQRQEKTDWLNKVDELYDEILKRGDCLDLAGLAVSGKDLIAAGVQPGQSLGMILKILLEDVIENPSHNDRDYLLKLAVEAFEKPIILDKYKGIIYKCE